MYYKFYGFERGPFQLIPDPDFLYLSKKHESALTQLEYGIVERAGFIVLTGEIGTGKTTIIKHMLRSISSELPIAFLTQTSLGPEDLLRALCQEFSLNHGGKAKSELVELLGAFLVEQYKVGQYVLIIIDEAQNLPVESLEEIRMLSNLDAGDESLLQVILAGQPALRTKLQWKGLRQLHQRIELSYHLGPLELGEVKSYIRYRIEKGGSSNPYLFDSAAMEEIFDYTKGIPRLINAVCHMCLVYGMVDRKKQIDREVVESVLEDRASWGLLPEPDEVEVQPAELREAGKTDRLYESLAPKLDRLIDISAACQQALAGIASSLEEMPDGDSYKPLKEKLAAEEASRKAVEKRLEELEKRFDEGFKFQKRLVELARKEIRQRKGAQRVSKK